MKDYTTSFSKTIGVSKVKQRQLIEVCRQYALLLLFWCDPSSALKSDSVGVKEEFKALRFEKACVCKNEKDTERRNNTVEFLSLSARMGKKSNFS